MVAQNNKRTVGKKVFEGTINKLQYQRRDDEMIRVVQRKSAELVAQSPYVSRSFFEEGLVKDNKLAYILHLFKGNIHAQDYAYEIGELHKLDMLSSTARAESTLDYELRNNKLAKYLKDIGKTPYDAIIAYEKATLRESGMIYRLGGIKMEDESERLLDIGLTKRVIGKNYLAGKIIKGLGVSEDDPKALYQVNETIHITGTLQDRLRNDAYIARRKDFIELLKRKRVQINSESSSKWETISDKDLVKSFMMTIAEKQPHLMKEVISTMKKEGVDINEYKTLF
jgi:hypothetical protein